jgi:alpha-beta hydrolase superfamily lysophospholipase
MPNEIVLQEGGVDLRVSLVPAPQPSRVVLFSVGSGGNPGRHLPLLETLARQGCTVVAPHFERLTGQFASEAELHARARGLRACLNYAAATGMPLAAIGHSIGAALLLGLAGGQVWMRNGRPLAIEADERIGKLVVITPAMDFFKAPGALDGVRIPLQAWAGMKDTITPPEQTEFLERSLKPRMEPDVRYVAGAGHFSFMNELPPQVSDTLEQREAFLQHFAAEVSEFIA